MCLGVEMRMPNKRNQTRPIQKSKNESVGGKLNLLFLTKT
jgi:hypothetical protein